VRAVRIPILPGDRWDLDHLEEAYVDGGEVAANRRTPTATEATARG